MKQMALLGIAAFIRIAYGFLNEIKIIAAYQSDNPFNTVRKERKGFGDTSETGHNLVLSGVIEHYKQLAFKQTNVDTLKTQKR